MDEAVRRPGDPIQMWAATGEKPAERPEERANVGWTVDSGRMSPLKPEEAHAGEKPGESSWRGHWTASYDHQPRQSCLRAMKYPRVSEAASAWLRTRADSCQQMRGGRNGLKVCEKLERARVPGRGLANTASWRIRTKIAEVSVQRQIESPSTRCGISPFSNLAATLS